MRTIIKENTWIDRSIMNIGWGNGYVLLEKSHRFHGKDYNELNHYINIHGGLTFSELITHELIIFFDLKKEDLGKWIIGFDTGHLGDSLSNWTKDKVCEEANNLLEQLTTFL